MNSKPKAPRDSKPKKAKRKSSGRTRRRSQLVIIGWRAKVDFPDFGLQGVQAKVDTGARTSSLHATHWRSFERDGAEWIRFRVYTGKRGARLQTTAEAPLVDRRKVRSSNGAVEERLVIATRVEARGLSWTAEISLAKRGSMAFPMLLGRVCLRNRFLVDSGHSYLKTKTPAPADSAGAGDE